MLVALRNKNRLMSTGKYISLEEARKQGKLERFADEHPSEGDEQFFDDLLGVMTKTPESADQTSNPKRRGED
jgi:hypothetical protein